MDLNTVGVDLQRIAPSVAFLHGFHGRVPVCHCYCVYRGVLCNHSLCNGDVVYESKLMTPDHPWYPMYYRMVVQGYIAVLELTAEYLDTIHEGELDIRRQSIDRDMEDANVYLRNALQAAGGRISREEAIAISLGQPQEEINVDG